MTTAQDPIAHAARLLREAAEELRQAHTLSSDRDNWIGEPEAKAAYDEHMAAAQALEDWEAAVGAGGVQPLRSVQEGCKLVPLEPTPEMLAALMSPGEAEVLASSPSETFALMLMDRAGIRERYSAMLGAAPDASRALKQEPSPTAGMNIAQRILHVGGRNNAAGYVEFGSIQAVEALVRQVLRDLPATAAPHKAPAESEQDLRTRFEALARDSYNFKRSRRDCYVNPAIARDWKWFRLGATVAAQGGK